MAASALMTREELLEDLFYACDDDGSGALSLNEFSQLFEQLDDATRALFHEVDATRQADGVVSLDEFVEYHMRKFSSLDDDTFRMVAIQLLALSDSTEVIDEEPALPGAPSSYSFEPSARDQHLLEKVESGMSPAEVAELERARLGDKVAHGHMLTGEEIYEMRQRLDREELLENLFYACDDDGSGALSLNEFSQLFEQLDDATRALFHEVDATRQADGVVSLDEFVEYHMRLFSALDDATFQAVVGLLTELAEDTEVIDEEAAVVRPAEGHGAAQDAENAENAEAAATTSTYVWYGVDREAAHKFTVRGPDGALRWVDEVGQAPDQHSAPAGGGVAGGGEAGGGVAGGGEAELGSSHLGDSPLNERIAQAQARTAAAEARLLEANAQAEYAEKAAMAAEAAAAAAAIAAEEQAAVAEARALAAEARAALAAEADGLPYRMLHAEPTGLDAVPTATFPSLGVCKPVPAKPKRGPPLAAKASSALVTRTPSASPPHSVSLNHTHASKAAASKERKRSGKLNLSSMYVGEAALEKLLRF